MRTWKELRQLEGRQVSVALVDGEGVKLPERTSTKLQGTECGPYDRPGLVPSSNTTSSGAR